MEQSDEVSEILNALAAFIAKVAASPQAITVAICAAILFLAWSFFGKDGPIVKLIVFLVLFCGGGALIVWITPPITISGGVAKIEGSEDTSSESDIGSDSSSSLVQVSSMGGLSSCIKNVSLSDRNSTLLNITKLNGVAVTRREELHPVKISFTVGCNIPFIVTVTSRLCSDSDDDVVYSILDSGDVTGSNPKRLYFTVDQPELGSRLFTNIYVEEHSLQTLNNIAISAIRIDNFDWTNMDNYPQTKECLQ